jgi:hypothetical protein
MDFKFNVKAKKEMMITAGLAIHSASKQPILPCIHLVTVKDGGGGLVEFFSEVSIVCNPFGYLVKLVGLPICSLLF